MYQIEGKRLQISGHEVISGTVQSLIYWVIGATSDWVHRAFPQVAPLLNSCWIFCRWCLFVACRTGVCEWTISWWQWTGSLSWASPTTRPWKRSGAPCPWRATSAAGSSSSCSAGWSCTPRWARKCIYWIHVIPVPAVLHLGGDGVKSWSQRASASRIHSLLEKGLTAFLVDVSRSCCSCWD